MKCIKFYFFSFFFLLFFLEGKSQDTTAVNHKSFYSVISTVPVNQATNGRILGMATDEDGTIMTAWVVEGALPEGIDLAKDGTISISNKEKLVCGDYNASILTIDEKNGITVNEITLSLIPASMPNHPSMVVIAPSKPLHTYSLYHVLAMIKDADGAIVDATLAKGDFPPGIQLSHDGKLIVSDVKTLSAGDFNFILLVKDEKNGSSFIAVTLSLS